jgi:hypothetical protein
MPNIYRGDGALDLCFKTQRWERVSILICVDLETPVITRHHQVVLLFVRLVIQWLANVFLAQLALLDQRYWSVGLELLGVKGPEDLGLVPHELQHPNFTVREPISYDGALPFRHLVTQRNGCASTIKHMAVDEAVTFVIQDSQLLILTRHDRIQDHLAGHWGHDQIVNLVIANVVILVYDFSGCAALITIQNVFASAPQILALDMQ